MANLKCFGARIEFHRPDQRVFEERILSWQQKHLMLPWHRQRLSETALHRVVRRSHSLSPESMVMFALPVPAGEVFSLMRASELKPDDYVHRLFLYRHRKAGHVEEAAY